MTIGQRLTAFYVDTCIEQARPEMVPMKGHVARRVKELLDCGVNEGKVAAVLAEFVRRAGRTALQLAEIHAELEREGGPLAERPSARRAAQEWIKAHGWPTGARFVRGRHAGTYVYDPLGTEPIPHDYHGWPYVKPSFDEILLAVNGGGRTDAGARKVRQPNSDDNEMTRGLPIEEALAEVEPEPTERPFSEREFLTTAADRAILAAPGRATRVQKGLG